MRLAFFIGLVVLLTTLTSLSFAAPPAVGTIIPFSGSSNTNETVTFTTTYTDPDGWANIKFAYLLINTSINGANCFYGYYNQNTNLLYLRNDANSSWLGGYAPSSANVIENSYARLDCAATSVSGVDTTLTINWSITFKSPFTGTKNTYLSVRDDTNRYSGWVRKGTWTIINQSPSLGTVTPELGTSNPNEIVSFTTTYTDPDGWLNIQYMYFLINTSTNGGYCFFGYYNQNTNRLYLRNDTGTGWLGGYVPGSVNVIENTYVKLHCDTTTVSGLDTTLTINWSITFKPSFTGLKNAYLYALDDAGAIANWTQRGIWEITNQVPQVGTINPSSGMSAINNPVNFTTTYTDPDSWQNIKEAYLRINTTPEPTGGVTLYYNRNSNRLFLRNNTNTSWLGNRTPGSSYVIQNMYVRLNCSTTTVSGIDTTLTINWNITFKPTFHGIKNTYLYVLDNAGSYSGWTQVGTWTIDATRPTGSISINNNDLYTSLTQITLTLSATDPESGVAEMKFSNDNVNWSIPEPYNTTKDWAINTGDGPKTVYVRYKNGVDMWSNPISDSIILDTTPPQNTSITIVQGEYTITRNITLTLHAEDVSPIQMMISENQDFSDATWEAYSTTRSWVLSNQEGIRTVYARFRDALGNESGIVQDSIILNLYNEMYPLYSPNGERIVYVGDRGGNWDIWVGNTQITTNPVEDTQPTWSPDGTKIAFVTTIDYGRGVWARNSDGTGEISPIQPGVRSSGSFGPRGEIKTYPDWSPMGDSVVMMWKVGNNPTELAIGNTDGTYPVTLGVQDCTWPSFSPDAREIVYSLQNSPYSRDIYKKVIDGEIIQLTVNGYNNNYPRYSPDGTKIVYSSTDGGAPNIFVMDRDGLNPIQITQNENPTIEYGHPCFSPDGTKIVYHTNRYGKYDIYVRDYLTGSDAYPSSQITQPISFQEVEDNIDIIGTANDNISADGETVLSGLHHYILEYGQGYEPTEWQVITESTQKKQNEVLGTLNITGLSDGIYTIRLRAIDEEGDTGTAKVYIRIRQILPPQHPSITTAQYTNTRNITLTLSAEGATEMVISEDPDFAGAQWEPYVTTKEFTLSEGDGQKTIYVKYRNQRNRETQPVSATIVLDTTPPVIHITYPQDGTRFRISSMTITGIVDDYSAVITTRGFNGIIEGGIFRIPDVPLDEGNNELLISAVDSLGNQTNVQLVVIYDTSGLTPIWPMFQFDFRHTGQVPYTVTNINSLRWRHQIGGISPVLIDGTGGIYSGDKILNQGGLQQGDSNYYNAIDTSGNLYRADRRKISAYWPDYSLKWEFVSESGRNYFDKDLVIDSQGIIYWVTYYPEEDRTVVVYAINPNGTLKWSYIFNGFEETSLPSIDNEGNVYIIHGQRLIALDTNGIFRWEYSPSSGLYPVVRYNNDTIYIVSNTSLIAIGSDGNLRWEYTPSDIDSVDYINLAHLDGGQEIIYILTRSTSSTIHALDINGNPLWTYNLPDYVSTSPVVDNQGVILAITPDALYAINPNGFLRWFYIMPSLEYKYLVLDPNGIVYTIGIQTIWDLTFRYIYAIGPDDIQPIITNAANQENIFSPNGDDNLDRISMMFSTSEEINWTITIRDSQQDLIRIFSGRGEGLISQAWDGMDNNGDLVSEGTYTYTIEATDLHNNPATSITNTIIIDATPPLNPSLTIAEGNITHSKWINLILNAEDAREMIISEFPDFNDAEWEEYNTEKEFTLSTPDGEKTVYVKFRDQAGNETGSVNAEITLDEYIQEDEVQITIDEGPIVIQPVVHLTITAPGADRLKISEEPGFSGIEWELYQGRYEFQLSPMSGRKIIYIKFYDNAESRESNLYSVSVTYDPDASSGSSISVREGVQVNTHRVTLQLTSPGAVSMIISEDLSFSDAEWTSYSNIMFFILSPGNGTKTIYARFRNQNGDTTPILSTSVTVSVPILLLDCGNPYGSYDEYTYESQMQDVLKRGDYVFEYWLLFEQDFPTIQQLNSYDLVILTTYGEDENKIDFNVLRGFLDNGGRLYLASYKIFSYEGINDFIRDYLHITGFERFNGDIGSLTLNGVENDPVIPGDVLKIDLDDKLSYIDLHHASFYRIMPDQEASVVLKDSDNNYYGLRYPSGLGGEGYRLVFFGFPVEIYDYYEGYYDDVYEPGEDRVGYYDHYGSSQTIIDFLIRFIAIENIEVYRNASIYIKFNTHLRQDTITQENIFLTSSQSGLISSRITYDDSTREMAIHQVQPLDLLEDLTLTITTGLQNIFGTTLGSPYIYRFTLNNLIGPLQITSTIPSQDSQRVPSNANIMIGFNHPLDGNTVNNDNIIILSSASGVLQGELQYTAGTNVVRFIPQPSIPLADEVIVTVTRGIRSLRGSALNSDYTFRFQTGSTLDNTLPVISNLTVTPTWFNNMAGYDYLYFDQDIPYYDETRNAITQLSTVIKADISEPCNWTIGISDSQGQLVKSFTGVDDVINQMWDGRYTNEGGYKLPVDEGIYNISIEVTDGSGNISQLDTTVGIDTTFPDATVQVAEGEIVHNPQITLDINYLNEVANVLLGNYNYEEVFEWGLNMSGWVPSAPQMAYLLDNREGRQYAQCFLMDRAGNIYMIGVFTTLDLLPEVIEYEAVPNSISPNGDGINDETEITAFGSETLNWSLEIRNNGGGIIRTYSSGGYEENLFFTWDGKDNAGNQMLDGVYTYYINGHDDENNNINEIQDTITIDTGVFRGGSIVINEAPIINSPNITLTLICPAAVNMQVSENPDLSGASWLEYSETLNFELTGIDRLHTIYARFQNASGNTSQAVSAAIILDTVPPPAPAINPVTSPTDNPEQTISGTKSQDTVEINIYGPVQVEEIAYPTDDTWQADIRLQEGFNDISIVAGDSVGNTSQAVNRTIYYSWNIERPVVEITSPQDGSIVNNGIITGRVSDLSAEVQVNGINMLIDTQGIFTINLELLEGENTITAVAADRDGDTGTDSIRIIYDTANPSVRITNPPYGATLDITPIIVSGIVDDTNISDITVNLIPAVVNNGQFTAEGIVLEQGENTITAIATDKAGNTSEHSIIITLGSDAPSYNLEEVYGSTIEIEPSQLPEAGSQRELRVKLYIDNEPAPNQTIQFQILEGQGQISEAQEQTDNEGEAGTLLTLDTDVGHINRVAAYPVECPQEKVEFIVLGRATPSAQITKLTDEALTYVPGAEIELIVKVTDQHNNPIKDQQIGFTVLSGEGQLQQETATANETGETYVGYIVGPTAGVINTIRAELLDNPAVNTTFSIQTIALPEGITVDTIIDRVNENDSRIQDIQADVVITSNAPWADPEVRLHIWQKGDKQKVQMTYPREMTLVRPPLDGGVTFEGLTNSIMAYNPQNQMYIIKTKREGQQNIIPYELCWVDYSRGVVIKTEYFIGDNISYSRVVTEFDDTIELSNIWVFTRKRETFYTWYNNNPYTTQETHSNIQINQGIPDSVFE